jgi:hypothetical protein
MHADHVGDVAAGGAEIVSAMNIPGVSQVAGAFAGGYQVGKFLDDKAHVSDNVAGVHKEDLDEYYERKGGVVNPDVRGVAGIANANRKLKDHNPLAYYMNESRWNMYRLQEEHKRREQAKAMGNYAE